jgi:hypothetical protein
MDFDTPKAILNYLEGDYLSFPLCFMVFYDRSSSANLFPLPSQENVPESTRIKLVTDDDKINKICLF